MFEEHFGLDRTPFSREIPVQNLFITPCYKEALARLRYVANRRQIMMMTGEPGVGKSTVLRRFKSELDPAHYDVFYMNQAGATMQSFYADLLTHLRVEVQYRLAKAKQAASKALLERHRTHGRTPVLLLDEAQDMPDNLLENLRSLVNYDCDAYSPLALVLVGTRKLSHRLSLDHHQALEGRIHLHHQLDGFTQAETMNYVQHHMNVAGAPRPIFTESALVKIHQASGGTPRTINKIAVMTLMAAYSSKATLIDDDLVARIIAGEMRMAD